MSINLAALKELRVSTPRAVNAVAIPRPRRRWRTRLLLPLGILGSTVGLLIYAGRDSLRPAISVSVAAVIPKAGTTATQTASADAAAESDRSGPASNSTTVQAPGWVEPDPFATNIPALAEGVVKEVLVLEGEHIEAGQIVARMIDDDARLDQRSAAAAVTEREAEVQQAQAQIAVAATKIPIEAAAADELRDEIERKRDLVKSGGVGAGEFRQLEIKLTGALARTAAARAEVDLANAALVQKQAALAAARIAVDQASLRLSRMEIRSPIAGTVLSRMIQPGTRMSMGESTGEPSLTASAVMRLYDPAKLQVRVDVPLADAAKVAVGTRATITTEALPDQTFTGSVVRAVHEANIQRNTVQFKVSIDDPAPTLKPEMLMRVKLIAATQNKTDVSGQAEPRSFNLLVPANALLTKNGALTDVWLVDQTGVGLAVRKRTVTTAPCDDDGFFAVVEGLNLSDRVVIDPPATLTEGARITIIQPDQPLSARP